MRLKVYHQSLLLTKCSRGEMWWGACDVVYRCCRCRQLCACPDDIIQTSVTATTMLQPLQTMMTMLLVMLLLLVVVVVARDHHHHWVRMTVNWQQHHSSTQEPTRRAIRDQRSSREPSSAPTDICLSKRCTQLNVQLTRLFVTTYTSQCSQRSQPRCPHHETWGPRAVAPIWVFSP